MTRKDYIRLAGAITRLHTVVEEQARRQLALELAHVLKADNGGFDYSRFMRAAEVPYPLPKPAPEGHGWRLRKTRVR